MDLIILTDGLYHLIPVQKELFKDIALIKNPGLTCFDLCDILRLKLTEYSDTLNRYIMKDGSGAFFGCMCK